MSRTLSELLHAEEPLFSLAIRDLEKASGQVSEDVRLTADIMQRFANGLHMLGMDPNDTVGQEVYYALMSKIQEHDELLARLIGGPDAENVAELTPLIIAKVQQLNIPRNAWVIKKSTARELFKKTPPKRVMKLLNYRSIDSMLKKENISELYAAIRFAETTEWQTNFVKQYKRLQPSDFETRDIEIISLSNERWRDAAKEFIHHKRHNVTHLKELGVVILLPIELPRLPGYTLTALPLVLHYINEIRLYSAYFKLQQVKPKFGYIVSETINIDPGKHASMAGNHVHWRVLQRYYGKQESEAHPEIFQPHVQPEDLHWRKVEEVLYDMHEAFTFWREMDYVGATYDGRPVTLNLMDVALSYMNRAPYELRAVFHFRESLWNEIFIRYMGVKTLEDEILKQLDNDMIAPEKLSKRRKS